MEKANINFNNFSDQALIEQIGAFIKHTRVEQNTTQAQLAKRAGLNRWTVSQIENGESINLNSLIQLLRALDQLHLFSFFEVKEEISPIEYAKLKKKQHKERVRKHRLSDSDDQIDLGW